MTSTNYCALSAAIQALKRKKRYEKQLQQIDGTLSTIEMQREALEGANTNTAVLTTMKNAADALKAAHKHMYDIFTLFSFDFHGCILSCGEGKLVIDYLLIYYFQGRRSST